MGPKRSIAIVMLSISTLTCCQADWITEWGGNQLGQDYDVFQNPGTITILRGGGRHYKFYSETSQGSRIPGVINNITIDAGATGNILITIRGDGVNGPSLYGASQLSAMDLRYGPGPADVCTLKQCYVGGGIATQGPVHVDLLGGAFQAQSISGAVNIRGVTLPHNAGDETGITINGSVIGALTIEGHANRPIDIFGDVPGTVYVQGDLNRRLRVIGAIPSSGAIIFDGDIADAATVRCAHPTEL